ncbi:hypothetical protein LX36DRAFT_378311 [Colletotrichum falcatum]|nr:hypothetical protein LX36DRAFT_378311 [Colletotrichum falcatum]
MLIAYINTIWYWVTRQPSPAEDALSDLGTVVRLNGRCRVRKWSQTPANVLIMHAENKQINQTPCSNIVSTAFQSPAWQEAQLVREHRRIHRAATAFEPGRRSTSSPPPFRPFVGKTAFFRWFCLADLLDLGDWVRLETPKYLARQNEHYHGPDLIPTLQLDSASAASEGRVMI